MATNPVKYFPVVFGKTGEFKALSSLKEKTKECIYPTIILPTANFVRPTEKNNYKSGFKSVFGTIENYVKFVKDLNLPNNIYVDLENWYFEEGMFDKTPEETIRQLVCQMIDQNIPVVPVYKCEYSDEYKAELKKIIDEFDLDIAIHVNENQIMNLGQNIHSLIESTRLEHNNIHLFLNMGEVGESDTKIIPLLVKIINSIEHFESFKEFVFIGTAFPKYLYQHVKKNSHKYFERSEWIIWNNLVSSGVDGLRMPNFGDYTIQNPYRDNPMESQGRGAENIRYTMGDHWWVQRGAVQIKNSKNINLMCINIVKSQFYKGEDFSEGNRIIHIKTNPDESSGNGTVWRTIGVNHHIEYVCNDLTNRTDFSKFVLPSLSAQFV